MTAILLDRETWHGFNVWISSYLTSPLHTSIVKTMNLSTLNATRNSFVLGKIVSNFIAFIGCWLTYR